MEYLRIRGGRALQGSVTIPGAKNSLLPIMAASVLCEKPVTLYNLPDLSDLHTSLDILRGIGWGAEYIDGRVDLFPASRLRARVPKRAAGAMRSSVFYLAPLLHRAKRVELPATGGCRLGARPIDIHLEGLVKMGAIARTENDLLILEAPGGLHGTRFALRYPSVGATETLMMAAVLAKGRTCLSGAACEPEIEDLARFLNSCGARITGAGSPRICITGVERLEGARHTVIPDRIVAATIIAAVAAAGGSAVLREVYPEHLEGVCTVFRRMGMKIARLDPTTLSVRMDGRPRAQAKLETGPYPAFPTDAAPLAAAALLKADGRSLICDHVFENRFACAGGFAQLGARASRQGRCARIWGVPHYPGGQALAQDLRGGAALVCAALAADGESRIGGLCYLRRGYAGLEEMLSGLGADICLREE